MALTLPRLQMYVYPQGTKLSQDRDIPPVMPYNTPLQQEGVRRWVDIVPKEQAEIFFMGQVGPADPGLWLPDSTDFEYFTQHPIRHVMDVDGDFQVHQIPSWLAAATITTGGGHQSWKDHSMFVRPFISSLMNDIWQSPETFSQPAHTAIGFRGQRISRPVRDNMVEGFRLSHLPGEVAYSKHWGQWNQAGYDEREIYVRILKENLLMLCPRGEGMGSTRYYETCFFGRVPVLIGDVVLSGYDYYDTSFAFYLPEELTPQQFAEAFTQIVATPIAELQERGRAARAYFDAVARPYYDDPTLSFIGFLDRRGLRGICAQV